LNSPSILLEVALDLGGFVANASILSSQDWQISPFHIGMGEVRHEPRASLLTIVQKKEKQIQPKENNVHGIVGQSAGLDWLQSEE
jgi:hypothetical protein